MESWSSRHSNQHFEVSLALRLGEIEAPAKSGVGRHPERRTTARVRRTHLS